MYKKGFFKHKILRKTYVERFIWLLHFTITHPNMIVILNDIFPFEHTKETVKKYNRFVDEFKIDIKK